MLKNFKKSGKKELLLEEAVLDDLAEDFNSLELPLSQRAFKLLAGAFFLIIAIVVFRIFFLAGWQKNFYDQRAIANASQINFVQAERGIIFDRFNQPLVKNVPGFRLNLDLVELFKNKEERTETIDALQKALNLKPGYIENLLQEADLEKQNSLTISRALSLEDVIKIKNLNLKAVQIENDFQRQYLDGQSLSHILGYIGPVDKNDIKNNSSLSFNDIIGKSGLEAYYNDALKGEAGETVAYRNVKGEIMDSKLVKEATPGNQLYSTIDSEFQIYFANALQKALDNLGANAAVGLALNPQDGEILSLISLPAFDDNKISTEALNNPYKPFFNRAISGVYPPGSTIKPLVAFAALKENVITPAAQVFSAGYLEIPNPYNASQPSRFLDWRANGWVNLYSALARSCNIYFYAVGGGLPSNAQPAGILQGVNSITGLGIEKLKEYWQKFGLGQKTGIDLPGENSGFLPDVSTKEKNGDTWRLGDTYNVSIGQGDLLLTPLQLLDYIASIANGGKIYKPFIVKKITNEQGNLIEGTQPEILKDNSSDSDIIKEIQRGMVDAVAKPYGTAYLLADLPVSVAAKTGTAQIENNAKINALFVGYAPVQNPQIAILVLIENAREGSLNAVPVAKDVLNWYYYNRINK